MSKIKFSALVTFLRSGYWGDAGSTIAFKFSEHNEHLAHIKVRGIVLSHLSRIRSEKNITNVYKCSKLPLYSVDLFSSASE